MKKFKFNKILTSNIKILEKRIKKEQILMRKVNKKINPNYLGVKKYF